MNYGNRLQNYAVQKVLTDLGFDCETILNQPTYENRFRRIQSKLKQGNLLARAKQHLRFALDKEPTKLEQEKYANFKRFTNRHIKESGFTLYKDTQASHLNELYDVFVVGSDQVWNPHFRNLSPVDFLKFASPEKRVAYAASIGISTLSDEYTELYRDGFNGFSHLSVREESGAAIIKRLTGKEAPVVIDPTLMLSSADWSEISSNHREKPKDQYLLTYFLGEITAECSELIEHYCQAHDLCAVRINDIKNSKYYTTDPAEFLDFIKDAAIFLTDSFHGVVFSLLMKTSFLCFDRISHGMNMNSRLDTLLKTFELEHRKYRRPLTASECKMILETDYQHTRSILEHKRQEARQYLSSALGLEHATNDSAA